MIRQLLVLTMLMFSCSTIFAQVGVGTSSPDPSSILDIAATNKGLLIPRVSLSDVNNSSIDGKFTNATGLLIYNTNTSLISGTGFYYWDGTIWNAMKASAGNSAAASSWSLKGNAAATDSFLGTTNDQPLNFRVNAIAVGSFKPNNSFNLGASSSSTGLRSTALGFQATATAEDAFASGKNATANNTRALAVGFNSLGSGEDSGAFGSNAQASGLKTVAVGAMANASNENSIAIGSDSRAEGIESITLGNLALSNSIKSIAIGAGADALADNGIALGDDAYVNMNYGMALGSAAKSSGDYSIALGYKSYTTGVDAIAVGRISDAQGNKSIAFGFDSYTNKIGAVAFGNNSESTGDDAFAAGTASRASGITSIAIGVNSNSSGERSIALGQEAKSKGSNSIAIGFQAEAQTNDALAFGKRTIASASNTTAIGNDASASGLNSSAFGAGSKASGSGATAIGKGAVASQNRSIVLGDATDSNVTVGIGTSSPSAKLQVNGSLRYVDNTPGDDNGKVLTSDAQGNASWTAPAVASPTKIMMRKYNANSVGAANSVFNFNNEVFNNIAGTSFSGNTLTLPKGVYKISSYFRIFSDGAFDYDMRLNNNKIASSNPGTVISVNRNSAVGSTPQVSVFEITAATGTLDFTVVYREGNTTVVAEQSYLTIEKLQ